MELTKALSLLIAGQDLGRPDVASLFGQLMDGELSEVGKTALLVGLACKGESPAEIAGAATAMRERAIPIPHRLEGVVDTCGTGGDGQSTFNISTAAALVAAGGGARVAKHGNRSVSSRSGSADVLRELGVDIELEPEAVGRCLSDTGLAFLFAPRLHPAMREVMPVRRELGVRTLFNVLGPLTNPAGAKRQVMGVFSAALVQPIAEVLRELGSEHALVVHGSDGLDEITTTGVTSVGEVRDGDVKLWELDPKDLGIEPCGLGELRGGEPRENADRMRRLLSGDGRGPLEDIVALNAAAALYVAGLVADLQAGLVAARSSLSSGAAAKKLEALRGFAGGLTGSSAGGASQ